MGNRALRTRLADLLKEKKSGVRLYTCPKKQAYKRLKARVLYDMILHLENIDVGTQIHDYGVNQTVAEKLKFETIRPISMKKRKKNEYKFKGLRGYVLWQVNQVQYESGYLSCGCGSIDCLLGKDSRRPLLSRGMFIHPLKTKEEIVSGFLHSLYSEYGPSYLATDYFKCLRAGIDIIDDNGFLIKNYSDVVSALNRVNKKNQ